MSTGSWTPSEAAFLNEQMRRALMGVPPVSLGAPDPYVNQAMPILVGYGPADVSTCTDLAPFPMFCWDVNGYYRELGVNWRATRRELMRAYYAKDGQSSDRLTYILKQLLNPVVRRAYDSMPLGEVFIDEFVRALIVRAAKRRAAEQGLAGDEGVEQAMNDMGWHLLPEDEETPVGVVDDNESEGQDDSGPPEVHPDPWPYAFYLWRSQKADRQALGEWQEALVLALGRRKVKTRIAIGFHGGMESPWVVGLVGRRIVVFLHEDALPTTVMAQAVVDRVVEAQQRLTSRR